MSNPPPPKPIPSRSTNSSTVIQVPLLTNPSGIIPSPVQPRSILNRNDFEQQISPFDAKESLRTFWTRAKEKIEAMDPAILRDPHRLQDVPLARVKKIMKLDDDVRQQMISAEAPVLFSKAAELFIEELTLRSWCNTEANKRKTLQKNDISMAIAKCDQFDFLIDIVPRDDLKPTHSNLPTQANPITDTTGSNTALQYFLQLPSGEVAQLNQSQIQNLGVNSSPPQTSAPQSNNVQFPNGNVMQATAIGQPIQLCGANGSQAVQLIPMSGNSNNASQIQFTIIQQPENSTETMTEDGNANDE